MASRRRHRSITRAICVSWTASASPGRPRRRPTLPARPHGPGGSLRQIAIRDFAPEPPQPHDRRWQIFVLRKVVLVEVDAIEALLLGPHNLVEEVPGIPARVE